MEQQTNSQVHENANGGTTVRKYVVGEVVIYEVKESELEELERGSQSDLYLEFAIACLTSFVSFFIAIKTVVFPDNSITEIVFILVDVLMAILGAFFLLLWFRQRKEKSKVIEAIKKRKKQ